MSDDHSFNSNKVFFILFLLTAVEVAWSFIPLPRWALWGGLLVFAFMKGLLIFMYFMHMKFEGWIVKGLIAPTPILILIAVFALMPDVSNNSKLVNPVGAMVDAESGQVTTMNDLEYEKRHAEKAGGQHGGH